MEKVKKGEADNVILCIIADENKKYFVHFINKKGNKFIDNTLGAGYKFIEYYYIRTIKKDEYDYVDEILEKTQIDILERVFFYKSILTN